MSDDIQSRLKKLPPFDEDVPMIDQLKKQAQNQVSPNGTQIKEEQKEVEEEVENPKEQEVEQNEEVSERTKEQVNKLTEHNRQLKEENDVLRQNVLESLRPQEDTQNFTPRQQEKIEDLTQNMNQNEVDDLYAKMIDQDGYINGELLIKELKEIREIKKQAEEAKKLAEESRRVSEKTIRDFEENKEVRKVHKKYPMLDPKNKDTEGIKKFNAKFWDDVRKEIALAPVLDGKILTFEQAADKEWKERYESIYASKKVEVENREEVERQKMTATEDAKRNINASTGSYSYQPEYYSKVDTEALRKATVQNRKGAIAERLRRSGY